MGDRQQVGTRTEWRDCGTPWIVGGRPAQEPMLSIMNPPLLLAASLLLSIGLCDAQAPKVLKDNVPGPSGAGVGSATFCGGKVNFSGYTSTKGIELWVIDFTSKGTVMVKDLVPGSSLSGSATACTELSATDGATRRS